MSSSLVELLGQPPKREEVIVDFKALIDAQVKAKKGVGGLAIKGAYKTVKAIKRGFVERTIDKLLDEWLEKSQRHYDAWRASGEDARPFFEARADEVAADLLSVTDAQAEEAGNTRAARMYRKLRPSALRNVSEAVPFIGELIKKHTAEA